MQESEIQRNARDSAIQAIRTLSNWLYWQVPACGQATVQHYHFTPFVKKSTEPSIEKLRDVAAARKQARETQQHFLGVSSTYTNDAEYWAPSKLVLPDSNRNNSDCKVPSSESPSIKEKEQLEQDFSDQKKISESHPLLSSVPIVSATAAAAIVRSQLGEGISGGLKEHIAGSLVRDIVNSNWLQVILAGVTWYLIGMYVVELVEVLQKKLKNYKK